MDKLFLNEHRCTCGKLLLKGVFFDGEVEIKCLRCGRINTIGLIKLEDNAAHYLMIINDYGVIVNASDSACRILGYSSYELIGKSFTQVDPTMPKEIGNKIFGPESVLDKDNYFQLDTVHQTKDGKMFPVIVRLKFYSHNDKERYVLVSVESRNSVPAKKNISGRKALDFMDNACDFYFCIDKNGIGQCVSPSVEKLFGFPPEAVIGKNYFDWIPKKTRTEIKNKFIHFSASHMPFRIVHDTVFDTKDKVMHNKKGKVMYSELYFTPSFDDSGKYIGYRVLGWLTGTSKTKKRKAKKLRKKA